MGGERPDLPHEKVAQLDGHLLLGEMEALPHAGIPIPLPIRDGEIPAQMIAIGRRHHLVVVLPGHPVDAPQAQFPRPILPHMLRLIEVREQGLVVGAQHPLQHLGPDDLLQHLLRRRQNEHDVGVGEVLEGGVEQLQTALRNQVHIVKHEDDQRLNRLPHPALLLQALDRLPVGGHVLPKPVEVANQGVLLLGQVDLEPHHLVVGKGPPGRKVRDAVPLQGLIPLPQPVVVLEVAVLEKAHGIPGQMLADPRPAPPILQPPQLLLDAVDDLLRHGHDPAQDGAVGVADGLRDDDGEDDVPAVPAVLEIFPQTLNHRALTSPSPPKYGKYIIIHLRMNFP